VQKREELLSKLKELSILKSVLTSTELYSSLVEHIASTFENDNKKHPGSAIQKDLEAWERAHFMLNNSVKREIVRVVHSVGVTQVMTANSSEEISMSAQADPDDADEEESSPYPMVEGTFSEFCVEIQNDNGDKIAAECDNSDEEGIC
jgi:hypothetical protein